MVMKMRPLAEITAEALNVLYRELGIVNTVRFVNQYTTGYGGYTQEREQMFAGITLNDIVSKIKGERSRPVRKYGKSRKTAPR